MAEQPEIVRLAALISSRTTEINEYLKANGIVGPSLDVDAPRIVPLSPSLMQARAEVLAATDELQALLLGPLGVLNMIMSSSTNVFAALDTLDRFDMLSHVEIGKEISFEELAHRSGLAVGVISQLMRMLVSKRIFIEPRKGFIAHNGSSQLLLNDPYVHGRFTMFCRDVLPLISRTADSLQKWPASQEPEETTHFLTRGCKFWDRVKNDAGCAGRFSATMTFLSKLPELNVQHLVNALDWDDSSCPKLMVDLGGHDGAIASYVLRSHPSLKCIVQDLPDLVSAAAVPEDLKGRLEFMTHDFFTEQTVRADAYFFRSIFHDWPDKYAKMILSNLTPALKPGARILLNEVCVPEPGVMPKFFEQSIRGYDLSMRQYFNAKERSIDEWKDLFESCDKRFRFSRLRQPPGSALALIEFVWEP